MHLTDFSSSGTYHIDSIYSGKYKPQIPWGWSVRYLFFFFLKSSELVFVVKQIYFLLYAKDISVSCYR